MDHYPWLLIAFVAWGVIALVVGKIIEWRWERLGRHRHDGFQ